MLTIRLDSPVPLIDQLVTGLRGAIARGEVRPGDALPTVRQLAADLGINLNTVSRAYRALESQGLLTTVRGRGTTVAAARESTDAPRPKVQAELRRRVREALADVRLAGLDRERAAALIAREVDRLWPKGG